MPKIVLTGGPYSGKSTVAERLHADGCAVVPEAAMRVIEQLTEELGLEAAQAWRSAHHREFQARIAELQLRLEAAAARRGATLVVCDRGLHDGIAYCRHFGVETPEPLATAVGHTRYDRVFVLDTLRPFRGRPETGRMDGLRDSLRVRDLIREVYREHHHEPVGVPELPVADRVAQIRRSIEEI